MDFGALEEDFSLPPPSANGKLPSTTKKAMRTGPVVSMIDPKRAQNVGIILKGFKMPLTQASTVDPEILGLHTSKLMLWEVVVCVLTLWYVCSSPGTRPLAHMHAHYAATPSA